MLASALCVADFHYNIPALSHLRSIRTHHRQLRIPALSHITSPQHPRPSLTASHPCTLFHHISAASAPIIDSFAS
ncbi:MAG: hypothetical protein ACLVJI_04645 [Bacilli bacterium]